VSKFRVRKRVPNPEVIPDVSETHKADDRLDDYADEYSGDDAPEEYQEFGGIFICLKLFIFFNTIIFIILIFPFFGCQKGFTDTLSNDIV